MYHLNLHLVCLTSCPTTFYNSHTKNILFHTGRYTCKPSFWQKFTIHLIPQNETPEPEPECREECVEKAKALWLKDRTEQETGIFTIEMHNIVPFG